MLSKKALKKHERCKELIEDFEDSGLSKQAFCYLRSISRASFDYYLSLYYQLDAEDDMYLEKAASRWLFPNQIPKNLRPNKSQENQQAIHFIPIICTDFYQSDVLKEEI